ncbi:hypothetical protein NE237_026958 [Protea cynaroides]|uniref:Uncharacterized protein n=1 Tax=Protea cynaroides TaxID=273540 RepID=A0A9Q0GNE5_9MAGN|nr:hypothetical protein NE237_026958 [Protea cynaroides]
MATSARDSRRRRIVERGPDRLALITGRIQNLPPSSPQSYLTSTSPELSQSDVPLDGEEDAPGTTAAKYEISNEYASNAAIGTESIMEPQLWECETSVDYLRAAPLDTSGKTPAITLSSAAQNMSTSMVHAEPHTKPWGHHSKIFTASRISSSVSASEKTRLLCSVGIALIVVLSHLRFPLLGSSFVRSIIAPRPVYLILLTDVTIVLAWLLYEKTGHSDKAQEEPRQTPSEDGYGWAEGLGKALEMGLVLQKVIGTFFLDCSVYVVIVVCGLSLVQRWL